MKTVFIGVIAESRFGELDRTKAAEDVVKDLIRCIEHLCSVRSFSGNIIYGMNQQNQVVFREIIGINHPVVEFREKVIVGKTAVTQFQEKFLCAAFGFRLKREFHV